MSLTQKVERTSPFGVTNATGTGAPRPSIDLKSFMRRPAAEAPAAAKVAPDNQDKTRPDAQTAEQPPHRRTDVAFGLLEQAATALPAMLERCRTLEADLLVANDQTREWQHNAAAMKLKLEALEQSLDAMRLRAETAEAQVAVHKELADQSKHQAAEAECLSTLFHDKVVTAFGIGSPAHSVLEAVKAHGFAN